MKVIGGSLTTIALALFLALSVTLVALYTIGKAVADENGNAVTRSFQEGITAIDKTLKVSSGVELRKKDEEAHARYAKACADAFSVVREEQKRLLYQTFEATSAMRTFSDDAVTNIKSLFIELAEENPHFLSFVLYDKDGKALLRLNRTKTDEAGLKRPVVAELTKRKALIFHAGYEQGGVYALNAFAIGNTTYFASSLIEYDLFAGMFTAREFPAKPLTLFDARGKSVRLPTTYPRREVTAEAFSALFIRYARDNARIGSRQLADYAGSIFLEKAVYSDVVVIGASILAGFLVALAGVVLFLAGFGIRTLLRIAFRMGMHDRTRMFSSIKNVPLDETDEGEAAYERENIFAEFGRKKARMKTDPPPTLAKDVPLVRESFTFTEKSVKEDRNLLMRAVDREKDTLPFNDNEDAITTTDKAEQHNSRTVYSSGNTTSVEEVPPPVRSATTDETPTRAESTPLSESDDTHVCEDASDEIPGDAQMPVNDLSDVFESSNVGDAESDEVKAKDEGDDGNSASPTVATASSDARAPRDEAPRATGAFITRLHAKSKPNTNAATNVAQFEGQTLSSSHDVLEATPDEQEDALSPATETADADDAHDESNNAAPLISDTTRGFEDDVFAKFDHALISMAGEYRGQRRKRRVSLEKEEPLFAHMHRAHEHESDERLTRLKRTFHFSIDKKGRGVSDENAHDDESTPSA